MISANLKLAAGWEHFRVLYESMGELLYGAWGTNGLVQTLAVSSRCALALVETIERAVTRVARADYGFPVRTDAGPNEASVDAWTCRGNRGKTGWISKTVC